jgi:hypothetical protein
VADADGERFRKAVEMNTYRRLVLACLCALIASAVPSGLASAQAEKYRTFATPEDAVKALIDATKKGDLDALIALFGPEAKELVDSADPATARQNRQVFAVAVAEKWHLEDGANNRKTLVIGNEDWPFPVPIMKDSTGWRFDTAAGKEEVIARRIGRNELGAIASSRAYVTAQRRYAAQGHDGKPAGIYATKFQSDPGKENGLYWPTSRGQKPSPLGDLVAEAALEGRPVGGANPPPSPLHGYYFRILTAQGAGAPSGAKSYVIKGDMTGGFALVAWPAQYNVTGVMTFIVGDDGIVREKDLGPETDAVARRMTTYNPDASWHPVQ